MKNFRGFLCGVTLCVLGTAIHGAPMADVLAHVLKPVLISDFGRAGESGGDNFDIALEPGAPEGARIIPGSKAFVWVPRRYQAPSTNAVSVRVIENDSSITVSFRIIVNHYVEITAGAAVLNAGESGSIWLDLFSSAPIIGFSCLLEHPALAELALDPVAPQLASALLAPTNDCLFLNFVLLPNQVLQGTQRLARLRFRTAAGRDSSFVALDIRDMGCVPVQAGLTPSKLINDGEVALVGSAPLLRALRGSTGHLQALLFGKPGVTYSIEAASGVGAWTPMREVTLSGASELLSDLVSESGARFFRARELP